MRRTRPSPLLQLSALAAAAVVTSGLGVAPAQAAPVAPADVVAAPSTSTRSVSDLQRDLTGLGYYSSTIDGVAGPGTQRGITLFQAESCLSVDGVAGPQTDAAITAKVKQVQQAAGVTQDGSYGPLTTAAVKKYQAAHGLVADGIAGPATFRSMGITRLGSCNATERGRIVTLAASQIGNEAGAGAEKYFYGAWASLDTHYWYDGRGAWCAGFTSWITNLQLGYQPYNEVNVNAYRSHAAAGQGMSYVSTPAPGDLVVYDWNRDGSWNHIGIVSHVDGTALNTIEGNTGSEDGRSRSGVWTRHRSSASSSYRTAFIRLH